MLLNLPDAVRRVDTQDIYYVEVQNRQLHYHTTGGEYVGAGHHAAGGAAAGALTTLSSAATGTWSTCAM